MTAYYNENDPFAAQWLRNLIREGLIADGQVDDRSIADLGPETSTGRSRPRLHLCGGAACPVSCGPALRARWTAS